jgi:hypothetical protein
MRCVPVHQDRGAFPEIGFEKIHFASPGEQRTMQAVSAAWLVHVLGASLAVGAEVATLPEIPFHGVVREVKLLDAKTTCDRRIDTDARFAVRIEVEGGDAGGKPRIITLGVHSPSKFLGVAGDRAAGKRFRFEGSWANLRGTERRERAAARQPVLFVSPLRDRAQPSGPDLTLAVVVAARFPLAPGKDRLSGNGVLVEGAAEGTALVLTCAHLVRREAVKASEVRVGVFRASFKARADGMPDYQEFPAEVVRLDEEKDLALLRIRPPSALRAARVADREPDRDSSVNVVSIFPFGYAGVRERWVAVPGQSGSPGLRDGVLVDLVKGSYPDAYICSLGGGPGYLVGRIRLDDIRAFLELAR